MSNLVKFTSVAFAALTLPTLASAGDYYSPSSSTYYASGSTQDPHQRCLKGEAKRKIIGSVIGGAAGSFIGKELAADNTKTEGAVLGALIGGSAGYGIGDKTIDCDPVYPEQPAPVYQSQPDSRSTTYSQPTYSSTSYTRPASYSSTTYSSGASYPSNVYVSNHPVYQRSTYSGSTIQSSGAFTTTSQPRVISSTYSQPTSYSTTRYTQPTIYSSSSYVSTSAPTYTTRTYSSAPRTHYHGKYACTGSH